LPDLTPSRERPSIRLDNQLCFALYAASNAIGQQYQARLKSKNLTYTQYLVLMALAEEDGVSISTLAIRLEISKATMTPLLRRLESKGLLRREIQDGNERQKIISLTDSGRQIWSESFGVSSGVFASTGLKTSEANDLIRLCRTIVQSHD